MNDHFTGQVTQKAVLKYGDSFVLVKEKGEDKWILPGGRLDIGEQPEKGLLREIKEELGIDCVVEKIISVDAYHGGTGGKTPKFFVFYLVSALPNQKITIDNEISETVLVSTKNNLQKFPMPENQRGTIERFLD